MALLMSTRDLFLSLDDVPGDTLKWRVVHALQQALLEGRIPPGAPLPGSRAMAETFQIHRQTVVAALKELEAEGWLVSVPNRGTFAARELPSGAGGSVERGTSPGVGFDLPSLMRSASISDSGALLLADGAPDPRLAPAEELAKGYQRAMRRHGAALLQDRNPLGTPLLREAVAEWITERHGMHVDADRILITRGSRSALNLLSMALCRPGDIVAVESPGNRGAWELFLKGAGLSLRTIPVDDQGIDTQALEELLDRERVRVIYLTPRRQFPTAVSLSRERRTRVLELASTYRVAVFEDDYDGEIEFEGPRSKPLIAMDGTGQVIHIGSISRLLAPGLRLGFLVLPAQLVPYLGRFKSRHEEQGDPVLEWAVADLIRDGELARHLRRARKTYAKRRDFLIAELQERLGNVLHLERPTGGMGLWLRVKAPVDAEAWVQSARVQGLLLNPPSFFFQGASEPSFRMGFAQASLDELSTAVHRLERALPAGK